MFFAAAVSGAQSVRADGHRASERHEGKGKKGKEGKSKEKGKSKKDNGEAERNAWTDNSCVAGECGYCGKWRHKTAQCKKQKKDKGSKPPAVTDEDSFWIFAVGASSGRNARILVDSGADEHVCPTYFASATGPAKGATLYDTQGHMVEAHGTRTVHMRLGPEGQSVGAEFRVTNVKTPIFSMGKLVKQGYRSEAGPTGCNVSKGDRSVTLDVVKNSLRSLHDGWTDDDVTWKAELTHAY